MPIATKRLTDIGHRRLRFEDVRKLMETHNVVQEPVSEDSLPMFSLSGILMLSDDLRSTFQEYAYAQRMGHDGEAAHRLKDMEAALVDIYGLIGEYFHKSSAGSVEHRLARATVARGAFVKFRIASVKEIERRMR